MPRALRSLAFAIAVAGAACHAPPSADVAPDAVPPDSGQTDSGGDASVCAAPTAATDIDVVLVVGHGNGSAIATAVSGAMDDFVSGLECTTGARPNLQIAVVSADLGAGGFALPGCDQSRDGMFLSTAQVTGCTAAPNGVIVDRDGPSGRETNYDGTLGEAVGCLARVPTGCAFEQPLAALARAFDGTHPAQVALLRPGADLYVIVAGAGFDCSASDPTLFDPAAADTLGPLGTFRCFEFGAQCNPDEPRSPGEKFECQSREASTLLIPTSAIAAQIQALKTGGERVAVISIGGDANAVVVSSGSGAERELAPACNIGGAPAAPAIRTRQFAGGFTPFAVIDACGANLSSSLSEAAATVAAP